MSLPAPGGAKIPLSTPGKPVHARSRNALIAVGAIVVSALVLIVWGIHHSGSAPVDLKTPDTVFAPPTDSGSVSKRIDESRQTTKHADPTPPPGQTGPGINLNEPSAKQGAAGQELSPTEQVRLAAYQEDQLARDAPIGYRDPQWQQQQQPAAQDPATTPTPPPNPLEPYLQAIQNMTAKTPPQPETKEAPTAADKIPRDTPVLSERTPSPSPFTLPVGTWIPARLSMTAVSDNGGQLQAQVVGDIRNAKGYLLIPYGAKLIGDANARVAYAQDRMLQVWDMILFPDGSTMLLDNLPGASADGSNGIAGKANTHMGTFIANAALSTAFGIGLALTQRQNATVLTYPSVGNTIAGSVGAQMGNVGEQLTGRALNRPTTVSLTPGTFFDLQLERAIVFLDGEYK